MKLGTCGRRLRTCGRRLAPCGSSSCGCVTYTYPTCPDLAALACCDIGKEFVVTWQATAVFQEASNWSPSQGFGTYLTETSISYSGIVRFLCSGIECVTYNLDTYARTYRNGALIDDRTNSIRCPASGAPIGEADVPGIMDSVGWLGAVASIDLRAYESLGGDCPTPVGGALCAGQRRFTCQAGFLPYVSQTHEAGWAALHGCLSSSATGSQTVHEVGATAGQTVFRDTYRSATHEAQIEILTPCDTDPCGPPPPPPPPPPPTGACVFLDGRCCNGMGPESCLSQGGIYQGDGTQCASGTCGCDESGLGACILFNRGGACFTTTAANCAASHGIFVPGQTCRSAAGQGQRRATRGLPGQAPGGPIGEGTTPVPGPYTPPGSPGGCGPVDPYAVCGCLTRAGCINIPRQDCHDSGNVPLSPCRPCISSGDRIITTGRGSPGCSTCGGGLL